MTLASLSALQAAFPGRRYLFTKAGAGVTSSIALFSTWVQAGLPSAASTPPSGSGEVPTNSTSGAIPLINPAGGNTLYLARARCFGTTGAALNAVVSLILMDRLVHTSGLSGTSTSAQTVNSVSVNRGLVNDAHAFLEVYSNIGTTTATATVSYTNQSGTAGQTGTAIISNANSNWPAGAMTPIQLASGDTGVQSVETVTLSASTGTAGNFGITIARTVAWVPMLSTGVGLQDYMELGLPIIPNSACLFAAFLNIQQITSGDLIIVEG